MFFNKSGKSWRSHQKRKIFDAFQAPKHPPLNISNMPIERTDYDDNRHTDKSDESILGVGMKYNYRYVFLTNTACLFCYGV